MKGFYSKLLILLLVGTGFFLIPSRILAADNCTDIEYQRIDENNGRFVTDGDNRTESDGFNITILDNGSPVNGKINPDGTTHAIQIRITATAGLRDTIAAEFGGFGIRFTEPGGIIETVSESTPLDSGSCPKELQNLTSVTLERIGDGIYINKNATPILLNPGWDCDIHLVSIADRGTDFCEFNGIDDETGDLRTEGDRDESSEPETIVNDGGQSFQMLQTELCTKYGDDEGKCSSCHSSGGVYTGIGCVPIGNMTSFIIALLNYAVGIGGGITFLMIIAGGFTILTSSGNPEKLQTGKEIIINAIAGLLLIIFSAVILRIIGVDILQIPGFGK